MDAAPPPDLRTVRFLILQGMGAVARGVGLMGGMAVRWRSVGGSGEGLPVREGVAYAGSQNYEATDNIFLRSPVIHAISTTLFLQLHNWQARADFAMARSSLVSWMRSVPDFSS